MNYFYELSKFTPSLTTMGILFFDTVLLFAVTRMLFSKSGKSENKSKNSIGVTESVKNRFGLVKILTYSYLKSRKQIKNNAKLQLEVVEQLTVKGKKVNELLTQVESLTETQTQLTQHIIDLNSVVEGLKKENVGLNQLWKQSCSENSFLSEKNTQLMNYCTSLTRSLRRNFLLNHTLAPNKSPFTSSVDNQPLTVSINESLELNEPAEEFVKKQIFVS